MKKLVNVTEVSGEGLLALLGLRVTFFCLDYIYTGNLVGVNDDCVLLEDAGIVYQTGAFTLKSWEEYQSFKGSPLNPTGSFYLNKTSICSFGVLK